MSLRTVALFGLALTLIPVTAPAQPVITFPGGRAVAAIGDDVLVTDDGAGYRYQATTAALLATYPKPVAQLDRFGDTVAAVGDKVAVGAPALLSSGPGGEVHLYDSTTGAFLRTLAGVPESFGMAVAALGGDVLVGAPGDQEVFLYDGDSGALLRTFPDPAANPLQAFGRAVAAVGGNVLVGAPGFDGDPSPPGAAYLLDASTGTVLRTFGSPFPYPQDRFGRGVAAFGGDVLIVGDLAAYRFNAATGALLRTYPDPLYPSPFRFGKSLATDGNVVLVGADYHGHMFNGATGALLRTLQKVKASDNYLGTHVALVGGNAVLTNLVIPPFSAGDAAHLFCGGAVPCGPCETCGPAGSCVAAPAPTCRQPVAEARPINRTALRITRGATSASDVIMWKGRETITQGLGYVPGDLGDVDTRQDVTLCLYDETGPTPSLVFRATAPAGGTCGTKPCWKRITPYQGIDSGSFLAFRYTDRDETPDGLGQLLLRAEVDLVHIRGFGDLRDSRILVKGMGPNLTNRPFGLPALPLALPVRVQLQAEEGMCWEARYSTAGAIVNTTKRFDGRPD